MKNALQLGQVRGIKVSVHWTFLILIAWIVFSNLREERTAYDILWSIGFILSIFACVVLHELGHALTALRFHIKTKEITLYPIGGIALLESMPRKPKEELLVALAGPAVNLIIGAILALFIDMKLLEDPNNLVVTSSENFLLAFVAVNFWLALFNLIPAFPMDGGRVFRAILSFKMNRVKATKIAAGLGQGIAAVFFLLGFYLNPFLIFIGVFIFLGAQAELNYTEAEELMRGHTLKDIMMRDMPVIQANDKVSAAVKELLNGQNKIFLVVEDENIIGTLSQLDLIKALRNKNEEECIVRDIMDTGVLRLSSSLSVQEAFIRMQRDNKAMAVVHDGDHVLGIIDTDNLAEFILIQDARNKFSEMEEASRT